MRIIQVLSTLLFGDAIGNHAVALKQIIRNAGYRTDIYAEYIDSRFPSGTAKRLSRIHRPKRSDIVLYHLSFESDLNLRLKEWKCRKILVYHNITPPHFSEPFSDSFSSGLREGLRQVAQLAGNVERCVAMSEFNKRDLISMGYDGEKIWVMPSYLIPFEDYTKSVDPDILAKYSDGWVNFLFVGRVVPNKKHEDVIRAFAYYKKHINSESRLIFVGSTVVEAYSEVVQDYIYQLGVEDVVFPGHISFNQLITFYRAAHIFLCMSEHEGFCVPLVEAMYFDVPVIAYDAAAVSDTLGGSGLLLQTKDPVQVALCAQRILEDSSFRGAVLERQRKRLEQFRQDRVAVAFTQYLSQIV